MTPAIHSSLTSAIIGAFIKLSPKVQMRNPVMFVVYVSSIITTLLYLQLFTHGYTMAGTPPWFVLWVALWLWFTVLFANFAESIAEGRGKAQAESLRALRKDIQAKKLKNPENRKAYELVAASSLVKDDVVLIEPRDFVPGDGQVIDGIASVDESAITGESAPVIR